MPEPTSPFLPNFELHRTGLGRVAPGEEDTAFYVHRVPGSSRPWRSCTCKASRRKTCEHLQELSRGLRELERRYPAGSWERAFAASVWYRLGRVLFEGEPQAAAEVRVAELARDARGALRITRPGGEELARYYDPTPARVRLLERLGRVPRGQGYADRAGMLEKLALFQASEQERVLNKRGTKTQRQAWEESFWHRLAYHCIRELGLSRGTFHPAVDRATGAFTLTCRDGAGEPWVRVVVPRQRVEAALALLAGAFPEQEDLAIHPVPLRSIFRVRQTTELDMEVRPVIVALQEDGEERFYDQPELEKFRYGGLVYVQELGVLAELERESRQRKFKAPVRMRLARSQVPGFLEEHSEALEEGTLVLDDPLQGLKIYKEVDAIQITPEALERSWYWLSVEYGFGNERISLARILEARRQGLPYLETRSGWVDLAAPAFDPLTRLLERAGATGGEAGPGDGGEGDGGTPRGIRLSSAELLRFQAASRRPLEVAGEAERAAVVARLLALEPAAPFRRPRGLASPLRPYQRRGVEWLRFLYENRLGGLLCDDMGLGKTHQAMALMLGLREELGVETPFLVVCPTSVISHWRNKIRDHAPGLGAAVYHGPQRDLERALEEGGTLVTSYGVLRRDVQELARVPFALAVLDEIQHIKNPDTLGYQAARQLATEVRLGLTGTPIENTLGELKALFDLVLPGYLGSDRDFEERYGDALEAAGGAVPPAAAGAAQDATGEAGAGAAGAVEAGGPPLAPRLDTGGGSPAARALGELRRLIAPFVLRRLKATVLDELPEKIEDLRTCTLSDDQVKLYRDALATRGEELVQRIREAAEPLPYIHVFALLNLLKQICDHPALALKDLARAGDYASGKWDLFRELLAECLDAGHKVVVFSQYLGMIRLMEEHLEALGVGGVTLTGASTRRGEIVDRFNEDPACRVFLGSLKAGGTGIDLVGGSVVIHYDRWWNAAREDQATDRVHRIGQKRAVHVLKLVTEGTLEEKIAALIDNKRRLMDSVVTEDDPHLAKIFSREELLELLAPV